MLHKNSFTWIVAWLGEFGGVWRPLFWFKYLLTWAFKLTRDCLFCLSNESSRLASSKHGFGLSQLLPEHSTPSSSDVPTSEPVLKKYLC